MIKRTIFAGLLSLFMFLVNGTMVYANDVEALFDGDSVLKVTITAPFEQIMDERPEEEYVAGKFEYIAADGSRQILDVGIRTRGEFRRRSDICPFAPLRVNFKKGQLDNTSFDDQDKLKLVTHCRNGSKRYDQTIVAEYLAYRILNLMTDTSFRVRLMRVNYVYTDANEKSVPAYAFFIEHKDRLAKRLQLTEKEIPQVGIREINPEYTNLVSVFQYLIGNTDFSPISAAPGEMCCHNHVLFGSDEPPYWSIPYDFDQSGLVNAPHAASNPRFRLRTVRNRLYRGRCINRLVLPDTLELYRAKRGEITALINDQADLAERTRKSMLSFVDGFYKTIDNEKRVTSQLVKACI